MAGRAGRQEWSRREPKGKETDFPQEPRQHLGFSSENLTLDCNFQNGKGVKCGVWGLDVLDFLEQL